MKRVLVIDNYDSFTYNLVHALEDILGQRVVVRRNDVLNWKEVEGFEYLVLSPGPGIPEEAGQLKEAIHLFAQKKKILGVCLGHQAIGEVFGAELINLEEVFHGVQTEIQQTNGSCQLFDGLDRTFLGGRYHSWVIQKKTLPGEFEITCCDQDGEIMGMKHKDLDVYGVQFHPESILTPGGKTILKNFLNI